MTRSCHLECRVNLHLLGVDSEKTSQTTADFRRKIKAKHMPNED
jgi:hypothetical protein